MKVLGLKSSYLVVGVILAGALLVYHFKYRSKKAPIIPIPYSPDKTTEIPRLVTPIAQEPHSFSRYDWQNITVGPSGARGVGERGVIPTQFSLNLGQTYYNAGEYITPDWPTPYIKNPQPHISSPPARSPYPSALY